MNQEIKSVLNMVNIELDDNNKLYEQVISREIFLSDSKYNEIKQFIPDLKKSFSSTFMTSLQNNAEKQQKWPLLNLIRQILSVFGYKMEPIRKSDGYTLDGKKKYKRYFLIKINEKIENNKLDKLEPNHISTIL